MHDSHRPYATDFGEPFLRGNGTQSWVEAVIRENQTRSQWQWAWPKGGWKEGPKKAEWGGVADLELCCCALDGRVRLGQFKQKEDRYRQQLKSQAVRRCLEIA